MNFLRNYKMFLTFLMEIPVSVGISCGFVCSYRHITWRVQKSVRPEPQREIEMRSHGKQDWSE